MTNAHDLVAAHAHSLNHRHEVVRSDLCGCFYCRQTFVPEAIKEWIDERSGRGTTALCPKCGIDSVIGSASGYPIDADFLGRMHDRWFSDAR